MSAFEDLLEPVTANEARAQLRELVMTSPAQIPAEVLDTPTTSEAAIVYALGEAEASRSTDRAYFARSASRTTATDAGVRIIANEQFSLPPKGQTFATTNIELDNASEAFYGPYAAGQFIVRNSVSKARYQNLEEITGMPGGGPTLTIGIRAIEAGTASDALPNEITELETTLAGVSITNPAAALAQDEESAVSLNGRIDAKIGSLGEPGLRGWNTGATATSFEAAAKNGPDDLGGCVREDGSRIDVTRTQVVNDGAGTVTLYLADDDGPIADADVPVVREAVQLYAEWEGLEVEVENATLVTVTYDGTLTVATKSVSADDDTILAAIALSLTDASRTLEVGEGPTLDYGRDAILDAGNPDKPTRFKVKSLVLDAPLTDTVLADGEVAALVLGTITIVRS